VGGLCAGWDWVWGVVFRTGSQAGLSAFFPVGDGLRRPVRGGRAGRVIARLATLVLALLLSAQATLGGGSERVCRYTGRRAAPCAACPGRKQPQDARLLPQDCCELRQGHPLDPGTRGPELDTRLPVQWVALPGTHAWIVPPPPEWRGLRPRPGHDPPPRERLFLSLRRWLI
jgi:hypothetical protein